MKILKTTTRKIIALIFVFIFTFNTLAFANYNPPREELEAMIDEVALKRAIPSVILKAIARVESVYEHFNSKGSPKISGSSIGLMQVSNRYGGYDSEKLKYDILYNIEAGADVLLNKWSMSSYQSVSSVGNMDPNVLENWYFALWAYNGWAQSNNPNMLSSYAKNRTYQQLVYDIVKNEYGQTINNIDFAYLPKSGKPSRSLVVPTPAYTNGGNIVLYEIGDYVRTDGIRDEYQLRDAPAGKYIHELGVNQLGTITEGPVLQNGYYWYKVYVDEGRDGWIERNWLLRTGDKEHGRYVFDDISFHWARKVIMELFNEGVISEAASFNPDNIATKEEFLVFLSKVIDNNEEYLPNKEETKNTDKTVKSDELKEEQVAETNKNTEDTDKATTEIEENALSFADTNDIHTWAVEYIQHVNELGLLEDYENELNPLDKLSRKEAANIIESIFGENDEFKNLDINTIFSDLSQLTEEEIKAVKSAYTNGIMSGKVTGKFCPDEYLTRAETAAVMVKIIDKLETLESK